MKIEDLDVNKSYTYADYLTWNFWERVELIKGKLFKMAPAPTSYHQIVLNNLLTHMNIYFHKDPCLVFPAPFDVRIPKPPKFQKNDIDIDTVVQPDITVLCDLQKLDYRGCVGPPDWVIEIASPSTAKKDRENKFEMYEFSGVREYWMVLPDTKKVLAFHLSENGKYIAQKPFYDQDLISPFLFPELVISLNDIFPDIQLKEVKEPEREYNRL